jgi:hypothetical protein
MWRQEIVLNFFQADGHDNDGQAVDIRWPMALERPRNALVRVPQPAEAAQISPARGEVCGEEAGRKRGRSMHPQRVWWWRIDGGLATAVSLNRENAPARC